jgi:hypothetical protein
MAGDVFSTALLAAVVTKLVDLARKFDPGDNWPKWIPLILSMAFGIAIALTWQVNTLAEIGVGSTSRLQGIAGQLLTGALVGGFGSGWHEVFDALSSAAKSSRAKAGLPVEGARR